MQQQYHLQGLVEARKQHLQQHLLGGQWQQEQQQQQHEQPQEQQQWEQEQARGHEEHIGRPRKRICVEQGIQQQQKEQQQDGNGAATGFASPSPAAAASGSDGGEGSPLMRPMSPTAAAAGGNSTSGGGSSSLWLCLLTEQGVAAASDGPEALQQQQQQQRQEMGELQQSPSPPQSSPLCTERAVEGAGVGEGAVAAATVRDEEEGGVLGVAANTLDASAGGTKLDEGFTVVVMYG